jgi:hypothetical protein
MLMRALYFTLILAIMSQPCLASPPPGEAAIALSEEWQVLGLVTGFHAAADSKNSLELRLIESNGHATVAFNPITLYLVITNNSSGELQEHVWRLPVSVAKVRKIIVVKSVLKIHAEVDVSHDPRVQRRRQITITVSYRFEGGVLGEKILVQRT